MKNIVFASFLAVAMNASVWAQTVEGTVLPHVVIDGGWKLRVAVAETVSKVVLESKAKGSSLWTAGGRPVSNLAGATEMFLRVPPQLRGQELRVKVLVIRPAPAKVRFNLKGARAAMLVQAGLTPGMMLSAEYFDRLGRQWKRFATAEAPEDEKKSWSIPVPPDYRSMRLRLTRLDSKVHGSESARFPEAFRTGNSAFPGRPAANSTSNIYAGTYAASAMSSDAKTRSATPEVEESDIWKITGSRIFFFNQLRGLQVIETANAAEPEIVSYLRMPAVGEDMYVLPGSRAVLVRRDWKNGGTTGVVLVDCSDPQARIVAELQVPGWYADSRLVDGRLVLATTEYDSMSYQSYSTVQVIEDLATTPRVAAKAKLDFAANAMGTGSEFLWVAGSKNWSWTQSSIALFPMNSLPALGKPLRTELGGIIYDKFKVHQTGETLFAVTQRRNWGSSWRQRTSLESYSLGGAEPELLQSLNLVEGESLHATRFDGNRAYVVTFEQIDPLWIIDLSDPKSMRVESELQVPGWSTYIQPVGGYLAAVGVDSGKVTASLFDVRDPANPSLSSRVDIGEGYSWSEANWDEKAVAIIPESGLILLPYSSFNRDGDVTAVQLVDMDATKGTLTKRGVIRHAFTPRRASALREGILASVSNRELFLLDASDRNNPTALSEVTLAFGADRILGSRKGLLIHTENGNWEGSPAVMRVSSQSDPDAVVSEASLGDGDVIAGDLRGDHLVALMRGRTKADEGRVILFDASKLPALVETGRRTFKMEAGWNASADIVWPSDSLAVAAVRSTSWGWWWGPWLMDGVALRTIANSDRKLIMPGIYRPTSWGYDDSITLHALDFSSAVPSITSSMDLSTVSPRNTSKIFAADGLVVFSSDRAEKRVDLEDRPDPEPANDALLGLVDGNRPASSQSDVLEHTFLRIVDYADPSSPYLWPEASLPGRLEQIAEFDRSAGLLFAENSGGNLEALFYEGGVVHSIAVLPDSSIRSVEGRTAWILAGQSLSRHQLANDASWALEGARTDASFADVSALRAHTNGLVLRRSGDELLSVTSDPSAPIERLTIPGWSWWWTSDLSQTHIGANFLAVPAGQYGIEILQ